MHKEMQKYFKEDRSEAKGSDANDAKIQVV